MQHPFTEEVTTLMGQLSEALKAHGTTMLYVPIPTKSVTLPTFLPDGGHAVRLRRDGGESPSTRTRSQRLKAKNVIAVDLLSALKHH